MILFCLQSSFGAIVSGVFSNLIFTLLTLYVFQQFRYWYYLKRKFHKKIFNTYWKRFPNEIVQTVSCKVIRNRIKFYGVGIQVNKDYPFEGEIIINPFNLKSGEGFHKHNESDGYAFLKVIIKDDNTFLVDAPYTGVIIDEKQNKIGKIFYQAFIWRKQLEK